MSITPVVDSAQRLSEMLEQRSFIDRLKIRLFGLRADVRFNELGENSEPTGRTVVHQRRLERIGSTKYYRTELGELAERHRASATDVSVYTSHRHPAELNRAERREVLAALAR